jgi:ABC-type Fe3+/spermidine/putrescine transport system ATPase subunit
MIEIDGLTKRYGDKTAVDRLSFVVEPGVVTGFLGPNGAGKSTTMRMIAGLDRPTSGTVRVNGKCFPKAAAPMSELGILLDARSVHPGLSARNNPGAQLRQPLTSREQDVFARIAAGMSNSEIAGSLFLSEGTVKIHVGRILAKLGLRDRVQAVVLAYESGLIIPGTPPPEELS